MSKPITCDEAREILHRFNNGHWNNPGEKARYSIPANPERDDDLRLAAFIDRVERLEARVDELERAASLVIRFHPNAESSSLDTLRRAMADCRAQGMARPIAAE